MKTNIFFLLTISFLSVKLVSGQSLKVSGKVTYSDMKPVSGAMIFVDDENTGKVTSKNGTYRLKVKPESKAIRVFTKSGEVAESSIDGQTEVNFILKGKFFDGINKETQANQVNDRLVHPGSEEEINIGYGSVKKKDLLTPVSKVDGRDANIHYRNIYDMLRGQPGVRVNGNSINIQGASSFLSSTEPLLVVDGVVVNTIDNIDPLHVRSIEILKGASASIYGSRGANGVILISLKGFGGR